MSSMGICSDGIKEDVIIYSEDTAWVFSGTPADLAEKPSGKPVPQVQKALQVNAVSRRGTVKKARA